jgi:predicted dehydrogenase
MGTERVTAGIACWVGEALLPAFRAMAADERLAIVAMGGTSAAVRDLAAALEVPHHDDPRQLAGTPDVDAVVLMDPERRIPAEELAAVMSAAQHRPLLTMTPRPGDPTSFSEGASTSAGSLLPLPVPWFRGLRRGRRLLEAADTFGAPASASVEVTGPGPGGLLATRLLDAFDLLAAWFGLPAFVEACGVRPTSGGDGTPTRLFVIARYPDGRAASVDVGADGGRHHRSIALHGEAGRLHMTDHGIDWSDSEGCSIEFEAPRPPTENDLAEDLAESIEAIVRGLVPIRPTEATMELLAVCEACMLSARTGEPEAIDRVRRMMGRV